ncbi:MAG: ABC transporter ATP-binding protein [Deltaproteobacteria bacterium]|nr:ABC transporter ATP-binding protein [Deltaproteobacteria bacterium]
MFGDYGYMEEGKLGKPYNMRLIRRLAGYAAPCVKPFSVALAFTVILTVLDLSIPYFSKIAIDRYIFSSWYRLDVTRMSESEARGFLDRYAPLVRKGDSPGTFFIRNEDLKRVDPSHRHAIRNSGVLSQDRFYRIADGEMVLPLSGKDKEGIEKMADGGRLMPYAALKQLSRKDRLKIRHADLRGIMLIAALLLLFMFLSLAFNYAQHYLLEFSGQHIMQDIRVRLFDKMQSQGLSFFDRNPIGRLVTRVTNDVENLNEMFRSVSITIFKDFFLLTGIVVILLLMNWQLALLSFAILPVIFFLTFLFSAMAREAFRRLRSTVAGINAFLQERIAGMRVIQLFARETQQMDTFARINHDNYLAGMRQIRVFAVFMPVMELFSSFAVALLIYYGGGKVIQEQLTLGSLVAFIAYIQMFFKPVRDISEKYNIMQSAMASIERIFEFMDHDEEIPEPTQPVTPDPVNGHLVFDRVTFGYDKDKPVIHDISFEVKSGETVALVGATGSGKTTVVNLVERFYDPQEGSISLDGVDLRQWPLKTLRSGISLCMQDVFLFGGSLAENISLGRRDLDAKAIEDAARAARALPFVEKLPQGFAREIGEGGATLSAGERQLLSFARALAPDPTILILDEATSSVDPETERLIQKALARMLANRTNLVVAHRLSTIRGADRILVMHHGRIVERGSHDELMALKGIYYRLSRLREG